LTLVPDLCTTRAAAPTQEERDMKFMTDGEATIEGNLLNVYADVYPRAVEAVATALRKRFESGELRGWIDADAELKGTTLAPLWRLERECGRKYIKTPIRALGVLRFSPHADANRWRWDEFKGCLLSAAEEAMARDVLHFARTRGWSKPQRGEELTFKRSTRRAA
jgi:hypothetical protein